MRVMICDICGAECTERVNYDENGYAKIPRVTFEIHDRVFPDYSTLEGTHDICLDCLKAIGIMCLAKKIKPEEAENEQTTD